MRKKITYCLGSLVLIFSLLLSACAPPQKQESKTKTEEDKLAKIIKEKENTPAPKEDLDLSGKKPMVTIEMEDGSVIKAELYPDIAPKTVSNFVYLAQRGFYDGLIFHRVIPNFMIQGGDPTGTGRSGPSYSIQGEFSSNGFQNDLKHTRGVLSMARTNDPNSAGSQFFIMVADAEHLDGQYAAFGKVTEGMEVVDKIVSVKRNSSDKPLEDQRMKKVTVDLSSVDN
jgi:peptidyl-prolyl cis-trans isomerase B (cyclophilin B)